MAPFHWGLTPLMLVPCIAHGIVDSLRAERECFATS